MDEEYDEESDGKEHLRPSPLVIETWHLESTGTEIQWLLDNTAQVVQKDTITCLYEGGITASFSPWCHLNTRCSKALVDMEIAL